MALTNYETDREADEELNDYDAPLNIRILDRKLGAIGPWRANCKYCGKPISGPKKRIVRHDVQQHQRTCTFR